MEIGVISDTHGLLRPEAVAALEGSDLIIHAGDVGNSEILERLSAIAPVHAVRGNTDRGDFGSTLPLTTVVEIPSTRDAESAPHLLVYVIHILDDLDIVPEAAGVGVVVYGHTHRPVCHHQGGVLIINPGCFKSTGKYGSPGTYAILEAGEYLEGSIHEVPRLT